MHALDSRPLSYFRRLFGLAASTGLALGALLLLSASVQAAGRAVAGRAPDNLPSAAVITVTSLLDAPDDNVTNTVCHETLDGQCSLRAAVQTLDHHNGGVIVLKAGKYNLTDDADGDLQFQKDTQIVANDPSAYVIQGGPGWTHRILRVQDGAQVEISDLTISGGVVPSGNGGGIDVVSGTLTLTNVAVLDNQAGNGAGIYDSGRLNLWADIIEVNHALTDGAGVYVAAGGSLTMSNSYLLVNSAADTGGGLYDEGDARIFTSTVMQNLAQNSGGGAAVEHKGGLTIRASTLNANVASAHDGGGVYVVDLGSVADVVNSTVSSNFAFVHGAGIDERNGGTTFLSSVTVVSNTAAGKGGGLSLFEPTAGQQPSGEEFRLRNSLVAFNLDSGAAPDCDGFFDSQGYNLVLNPLGCHLLVVTTGNITGQDPKLLPFGYHGGVTALWALAGGSPAIDAGNPAGCQDNSGQLLVTDQRGDGYPRSVDGNGDGTARCDIGAYEDVLNYSDWLPLTGR
jgi:CSLREA domain-containing protein